MVKSMTRFKRILSAVLCFAAVLSCLCLPAAANTGLDITKTVTLTIKHKYQLKDVSFSVYRIAELKADGSLKALKPFEEYVQKILATDSKTEWANTANKLDMNTETLSKASGKTGTTDSKGVAVITGLKPGLYLIGSTRVAQSGKVYVTAASLVTLPQLGDQGWNYDARVNAKADSWPERMDLKVVKVWRDTCHPERRPKSITIYLMRDGVRYDTVELPRNGKWEYTWKNLDMSHTWTVAEDRPSGYRDPDISYKNGVFTVTNTCNRPGAHNHNRLPQTGQLWWPVPVLLAAGLVLVIIGLVRRREDAYED